MHPCTRTHAHKHITTRPHLLTHLERQKDADTTIHTDIHIYTHTHIDTHRHTQTQTHRHTYTHAEQTHEHSRACLPCRFDYSATRLPSSTKRSSTTASSPGCTRFLWAKVGIAVVPHCFHLGCLTTSTQLTHSSSFPCAMLSLFPRCSESTLVPQVLHGRCHRSPTCHPVGFQQGQSDHHATVSETLWLQREHADDHPPGELCVLSVCNAKRSPGCCCVVERGCCVERLRERGCAESWREREDVLRGGERGCAFRWRERESSRESEREEESVISSELEERGVNTRPSVNTPKGMRRGSFARSTRTHSSTTHLQSLLSSGLLLSAKGKPSATGEKATKLDTRFALNPRFKSNSFQVNVSHLLINRYDQKSDPRVASRIQEDRYLPSLLRECSR
jgi:hypothetical protein